ncbi:oligosaccharide flippase family protein [Pseudoalteromonas sp. TB64]|uniref:oligosaccharide flippase family protein n=1 Tax=Pseudoalteromonas sp. TB64 TaxID=1938600 RepID=UPI000465E3BA|nr:oligosaccharide flippase family protein [Pseudoalteromonas sp. TB64]
MKGLLWVFFEKVGVTLFSLVATFWYANLLGPTGFGMSIIILSSSLFISTIIENLQQYPLIAANEDIENTFKTSAIGWLFLSIFMSILLYVILYIIYGADWWMLILLSVSYIPISSISRVYIADLIIKQRYKQLALRAFWGKAAGVGAGLLSAYAGHVELAIILQSFVAAFIALLVMSFSHKNLFKSDSHFSFPLFTNLIKEGIPSGVAIIEQNAKNHGLIIFLGAFIGPQISGIYALAIRFVDIPRTLIGIGFITWATGKFHSVKYEARELLSTFNTAFLYSTTILVPCYVGLATIAKPLILEFFGVDWLGAYEIIIGLAVYQCITSLYLYLAPLQVLFKTTYETLFVNIASTVLILLSVVFLSDLTGKYSPLIGMYLSLLFIIPKFNKELCKLLDINIGAVFKVITGCLISAAGMCFIVIYIQINLKNENLYLLIGIGFVSYCLIYMTLYLVNIIDRKILAKIKSL